MISAKTAARFAAACRIGAVVAGRPQAEETALESYGKNLGIAFQVVDDLLDYTADEEVLGKPVGGDVREGKMTLSAIYLLEKDGGRARALLEGIVRDRTISPDSWRALRGLLIEHRVIDRAYEKAAGFAAEAKRGLGQFPPTPEPEALLALPDYVLARDR